MILLITGASHTGKTLLAQKLLEKYSYPTLSLDLLKMGLIRSGYTTLTPMDDDKLTDYLAHIKYLCLVMSEKYIRNHFADIRNYASVIEDRGEDEDCTLEWISECNLETLKQCQAHDVEYLLIDDAYPTDVDL